MLPIRIRKVPSLEHASEAGREPSRRHEKSASDYRGDGEEKYAKDKVWLAVGGVSIGGGNACGNKLSAGIH